MPSRAGGTYAGLLGSSRLDAGQPDGGRGDERHAAGEQPGAREEGRQPETGERPRDGDPELDPGPARLAVDLRDAAEHEQGDAPMGIPLRRAMSEWPSSCTTMEAKKARLGAAPTSQYAARAQPGYSAGK